MTPKSGASEATGQSTEHCVRKKLFKANNVRLDPEYGMTRCSQAAYWSG